jgi:hypothetical protein
VGVVLPLLLREAAKFSPFLDSGLWRLTSAFTKLPEFLEGGLSKLPELLEGGRSAAEKFPEFLEGGLLCG